MNETLRTMESRRSIRSYKPDPIPDDVLREILQAGLDAPSGRNCQSPIIIVITDTSMRRKIAEENAINTSVRPHGINLPVFPRLPA